MALFASAAAPHPDIVPSRVSKIKLELTPVFTGKDPLPITMPVGVPLAPPLLGAGGTLGLVPLILNAVAEFVYTVESPVPVSLTQKGLVAEVTLPQGFTRFGSTRSAPALAVSAIRLCL